MLVQLDTVDSCTWLNSNIDNTSSVAQFSAHLLEHVAHSILQEVGSFKRKLVLAAIHSIFQMV
jgi:hypothetical protein